MKARVIYFVPLVLTASLVLATCTANGGSIYATIENEQKVSVSQLSVNSASTLVIADIAKAAANGPYYVAAGAVYQGTLTGSTVTSSSISWDPNALSPSTYRPYNPKGTDGTFMLCNSLVEFEGNLYGGFYTASGAQVGLYIAPASNPVTANWTAVSGFPAGEQVVLLRVANTTLFIVGTSGSYTTYDLYRVNTTTTTATATISGLNKVTGIAWDGFNYFMSVGTATTGSKVYKSASPAGLNPGSDVTPTLASGDQINSIFGAGGYIFVATGVVPIGTNIASGIFYSNTQGASWSNVVAPVVSSVTIPLLCVAGPIDTNADYLVGSDGYSYFTLNLNGTPALTRYSDTTVALYAESVSSILVDTTHVLMGTNANGLWGAEFAGGASSSLATGTTWIHE